jgi:hypothetical protein
MKNSKIKAFVKENKITLIKSVVIGAAVGIGVYYGGSYIYKQGFINGINRTVDPIFHGTIKWFDETFDNLHLKELWDQWAAEHPEQVFYPK